MTQKRQSITVIEEILNSFKIISAIQNKKCIEVIIYRNNVPQYTLLIDSEDNFIYIVTKDICERLSFTLHGYTLVCLQSSNGKCTRIDLNTFEMVFNAYSNEKKETHRAAGYRPVELV